MLEVIMVLLMSIFGFIYMKNMNRCRMKVVVFKGLVTLMTAIPILKDYTFTFSTKSIFLLGIVLCAIADISLEFKMIVGTIFFALAHCCFIVGFFKYSGFYVGTILLAVEIFYIIFGVIKSEIKNKKEMIVPGLVYMGILGLMTGFSVAASFTFSGWVGFYALMAGLLFALSDVYVIYHYLSGKGSRFEPFMLGVYYASMLNIGLFASTAPVLLF